MGLTASVDSLVMVHRYSYRPPPEELRGRGLRRKDGNLPETETWYYNGPKGKNGFAISFYETWQRLFGLRVQLSIPKFSQGNNIDLLPAGDVYDVLTDLSREVTARTGMPFDALTAFTGRIDYAINYELPQEQTDAFFDRYHRFKIPRLKYNADLSHSRAVYHENKSRTVRTYDKLLCELGPDEYPRIGSIEETSLIRIEYAFNDEDAVKRLANRFGLFNTQIQTMLAPETIRIATDEALGLLKLDTFDSTADYSFRYFFDRTGDIAAARKMSSFVSAYQYLGKDFYLVPSSRMSAPSYKRLLSECQHHGF